MELVYLARGHSTSFSLSLKPSQVYLGRLNRVKILLSDYFLLCLLLEFCLCWNRCKAETITRLLRHTNVNKELTEVFSTMQ